MIGVDTNIILNVLRKDDPALHKTGSFTFFKQVQQKNIDLAISAITITELFRKPFKNKSMEEKQKIDSFLHLINAKVIPIENDASVEAARLIEELNVDFADALIAASMLFAGIKMFVTRNIKDYNATALEVLTPENFVNKYCE